MRLLAWLALAALSTRADDDDDDDELRDVYVGVQCPGLPAADFCDCHADGDCSEEPSFCACADARACCAGAALLELAATEEIFSQSNGCGAPGWAVGDGGIFAVEATTDSSCYYDTTYRFYVSAGDAAASTSWSEDDGDEVDALAACDYSGVVAATVGGGEAVRIGTADGLFEGPRARRAGDFLRRIAGAAAAGTRIHQRRRSRSAGARLRYAFPDTIEPPALPLRASAANGNARAAALRSDGIDVFVREDDAMVATTSFSLSVYFDDAKQMIYDAAADALYRRGADIPAD